MSVKHSEYKKSIDVILKCWNVNTDAFQLNSFSVLIVPGDRTQLSVRLLLKKKKKSWHLLLEKNKTKHHIPPGLPVCDYKQTIWLPKASWYYTFPGVNTTPTSQPFFFRYFLSDSVNPQSQGVGVGVGDWGTGQKRDRGNVRCWWAAVCGGTSGGTLRDWQVALIRRVHLGREENFAYLFGRELYQGTFIALKGRKEKRERWETMEPAAKILHNTAYTEVS